MIKIQPDKIVAVKLEAVLMPNGEIICLGKTIGWFKTHKQFLTVKDEEKKNG